MADQFTPTAIANLALDAASLNFTLGDIQEGTRPAQVCLRAYGDCLRQLLRSANWNCARKQAPLFLLADATGQTPNVGRRVPGSQFTYAYALPTDAAKIRYIPWNPFLLPAVPADNIVPPDSDAPLTTNSGQPAYLQQRPVPARFLVTTDVNNIPEGAGNDIQGISPIGRTVVLTNVKNADAIYTFNAMWPSIWDYHFRAAMVAYLASEIAVPLAEPKDKRFAVAERDRNIAIATEKIKQARISDGQEGWHSSDLSVDWMRVRVSGGYGGWGSGGAGWGNGGGGGYLFGGWDACGFGNGSAY